MRSPQLKDLTDLNIQKRSDFLLDMSLLGEAIENVCDTIKVNYSIYGNEAPFVHAHVFPRYEWKPEYNRKNPVWTYPETNWTDPKYSWSKEKHAKLMGDLSNQIQQLMNRSF